MKVRQKRKRKWYVPIAVLTVTIILGIQVFNLYSKLSFYENKRARLMEELDAAMATEQELSDYEAYTKTEEYIINMARTKLGLVKDNEIIFKQR